MLVGRDRELEAIASLLARARTGTGAVVALVGAAGMGKTRLADEVAQRASCLGFQVHWGRAWETGGAPAYWPWVEIATSLGALGPATGAAAMAALLGPGEPAAPDDRSRVDPAEERFRMQNAVATFLRDASQRAPLLILLDDAHAADVPSLELLHFLARTARSIRMLILTTWREAEARSLPVAEPLGRIALEAVALQLGPLAAPDVNALLLASAGQTTTPPELLETLLRLTEGNPLFVQEALRLLAAGIDLSELPTTAGISASVIQRAQRVSPAARELLPVAAVLGRDVSAELLGTVLGLPRSEVELRLAELARACLLANRSGAWGFAHVLVRDALYGQLPAAERRRLHACIAAALEPRIAMGDESVLALSAHHALAALPEFTVERSAELALLAAARARARGGYEEAVALLERALAALPADPATAQWRGELQSSLGWAALDAGKSALAQQLFGEVISVARRLGDTRLFARAALGAGAEFVFGSGNEQLQSWLEEALAGVDPEEVVLRARLCARLAATGVPGPRSRASLQLAREAMQAVHGHADDQGVLEIAVCVGATLQDFADPAEAIAVNEEVLRRARRVGNRVLELRGLSRLVPLFLELGDVARADALLPIRDELAEKLILPRFQWQAPVYRSMRRMIEGRFDECDAAVAEANERTSEQPDTNAPRCLAVHRFWLLLLADRVEELVAHEPLVLRVTRGLGNETAFGAAVSAAVRARAGDMGAARRHLERLGGAGWLDSCGIMSTLTAAEAILEARVTERYPELLAKLRPRAHCNGVSGPIGLVCFPSLATWVGALEAALGEPERAQLSFSAALERAQAMRAPAHEAWVRFRWGCSLPSQAAGQLEAAIALADRLEMPNLALRARRARERCATAAAGTVPRPSASSELGPLTFSLQTDGKDWSLRHAGSAHRLRPSRGLTMISRLLEQPGRPLHALELAAEIPGAARPDAGDAGPLLDEKARLSYRRRLQQLREDLDQAEVSAQAARADRIRSEIDALCLELARGLGLGGRSRRAGSSAERARSAVQRRVRDAIRKIGDLNPEIGRHLDWAVRTGTFCVYDPHRGPR